MNPRHQGQSVAEYVIIISLVGIASVGGVLALLNVTGFGFSSLSAFVGGS